MDSLLRVAASVKGGHALAAPVVRQDLLIRAAADALASAIKEYGALRRTVYAARYLADETYQRRIGHQLNKGENVHALKRSLAYAGEGALRRRHHEQQAEQMWCLTLATSAIVTWTAEYNGLAVTALRRARRDIDDEVLAYIWPTHHENIHFYGTHSVDVDVELAELRLRRLPAAACHQFQQDRGQPVFLEKRGHHRITAMRDAGVRRTALSSARSWSRPPAIPGKHPGPGEPGSRNGGHRLTCGRMP